MLYGITATDPVTFGGMVLVVGGVAIIACWVPAYRASRVEAIEALRSD
jgi:ABC-type antimicrobial peptide transport system permease subunit